MADLKITTSQAPAVRAMSQSDAGELFDYESDLATAAELAEQGITAAPVSYTIFKSSNAFAQYAFASENLTPVTGYNNIEIDPEDAFYTPSAVEELGLNYNFSFIPASRSTQPFSETGFYLIKFMIYPKEGAAVAFQLTIQVI